MSLQFVVNKPRGPFGWWIMVPILGLTVAALWWSAVGTRLSITGFIDGLPWIGDFVGRMLPPNFAFMQKLVQPAIETVQIALWGTLLGIVLALPVCFFAARNLSPYAWVFHGLRQVLNVMLGINEINRFAPPDMVANWLLVFVAVTTLLASEIARRLEWSELRWPALILGLVAWAAWAGYAWEYRAEDAMPADALRRVMRIVYAADQWAFIVAVLGFGAKHLNRGGPVLRYLTVGVFPFYIVHQTVIVVVGHHLAQLRLPLAAEAGILIAATFAACFLAYELARRLGWAGLLLGVRPQAAKRPPRAA